MRRFLTATAIAMAAIGAGHAQQPAGNEPRPSTTDPRANLKPGFRDAQVASWNLDLVATLPKPAGFFDPSAPAGPISEPEQPDDAPPRQPQPGSPPRVSQRGGAERDPNAPPPPPPPGSGFTNS